MADQDDREVIDLMDAFPATGGRTYDALIKLKLVHAPGQSVFVPDFVVLEAQRVWLQPYMFTAPLLSFYRGNAYAQFQIDLADGERILVGTTNDRHVRAFPDGSHVFRCRISGSADIPSRATGACRMRPDAGIDLRLFHHTAPATLELINASSVLRGSAWNYQGTTKLSNVSYAYLTSLGAIRTPADLEQIAMASEGWLHMLLDDHTPPSGVVPIRVYRESTLNRTATLPLWVPCETLASPHIWKHSPSLEPVFYEIAHPAIFRIGLKLGEEAPIVADGIHVDETALRRFKYVVIGDATDALGITAPFNEEDTRLIFKIEDCLDSNPLTFWRENANTDLFSGKPIDLQKFEKS